MLSGRAFDELDTTYRCVDTYKGQISAEVGAGRVLKVLLHLSSALSSFTESHYQYHMPNKYQYRLRERGWHGLV